MRRSFIIVPVVLASITIAIPVAFAFTVPLLPIFLRLRGTGFLARCRLVPDFRTLWRSFPHFRRARRLIHAFRISARLRILGTIAIVIAVATRPLWSRLRSLVFRRPRSSFPSPPVLGRCGLIVRIRLTRCRLTVRSSALIPARW